MNVRVGNCRRNFAPCPSSGFHAHVAGIDLHVVAHDGEAQAGAFFFRAEVGFKNFFCFLRWNARPVVRNRDEDDVLVRLHAHVDVAAVAPALRGRSAKCSRRFRKNVSAASARGAGGPRSWCEFESSDKRPEETLFAWPGSTRASRSTARRSPRRVGRSPSIRSRCGPSARPPPG